MSLLERILAAFRPAPGIRRVEPRDAAQRVREKKGVLVDVREPREWQGGVAQKAVLLPLSDLTGARRQWRPFLDRIEGREILLYCRSGSRCAIAARILSTEGFQVASAGTLRAWDRAGLPICKPRSAR